MAMCSICGKRRRAGKNVSHSNRHTNRWFLPNVQKAKIFVDGRTQRVSLCTRCLRTAQNKRLAV
ncbi:MAG: 50S ribosomal protein L28 [Chloroflexi bacterium]|nr:50S ribosomal protein L28 [Chloroflexota bacterium]MDA1173469.1 50S ribosomal protein L28 [Chloroflexota bacterium]